MKGITHTDYIEAFEGAISEIRAGSVLVPKEEIEYAWNNSIERAIRILEMYKNGEGLFQITKNK